MDCRSLCKHMKSFLLKYHWRRSKTRANPFASRKALSSLSKCWYFRVILFACFKSVRPSLRSSRCSSVFVRPERARWVVNIIWRIMVISAMCALICFGALDTVLTMSARLFVILKRPTVTGMMPRVSETGSAILASRTCKFNIVNHI